MKSLCSQLFFCLCLVVSIKSFANDFNPTPFPLERSQRSNCGTWLSLTGQYRLWVTPSKGDCDQDEDQLQVTLTSGHVALARGILKSSENQFCGALALQNHKTMELCVWRQGTNLYSNVRRDSPWQPFEIFSKETYY